MRLRICALVLTLAAIGHELVHDVWSEFIYEDALHARPAVRVGARFLELQTLLPPGVGALHLLTDRNENVWPVREAQFVLTPRVITPWVWGEWRPAPFAIADVEDASKLRELAREHAYAVRWLSADGRTALLARAR